MVEWAERFDAPIYLHESNRRWVMRPSERIAFWSGDLLKLPGDISVVRLGGHFPGSTVLHWTSGAGGRSVLLTGDTIYVVVDRNWVSFMYSYPNLIPLPASEVRRIRDAINPYHFERDHIHAPYVPREEYTRCHQSLSLRAPLRRLVRYNRASRCQGGRHPLGGSLYSRAGGYLLSRGEQQQVSIR